MITKISSSTCRATLSLEANVIKANLRGVLSQPAAFKRVQQRAPTDFTSTRVQQRRISKNGVYLCDLKFILDYGLLRTSTIWCFPQLETMSRRNVFHSRENSHGCNYVFSDISAPSASCGAYYRQESLDARQMIRNNTRYYSYVDTKADVHNVITMIMKIHGACKSGRFILLTFR